MMDPRTFHIQFVHALRLVQWDRPNGAEYFLVGDGDQFFPDRLQEALDRHFDTASIWASLSRHEAILLERASAASSLARHTADKGSLTVVDVDLTRFMQIHAMGAARCVVLQANNSFKGMPLRGTP